MRIVLDTNVLLAGFGTHGLCEALVEGCFERHVLVCSEHILEELERHLSGKFRVGPRDVREIVRFVREQATMVVPAAVPVGACSDPDDLPVLGTAAAGDADLLATGDAALLALKRWEGVAIVSPRACYERLAAEG